MTSINDYNLFMDNLVDNAYANFHETDQSKVLQEKLAKMEQKCESMLAVSERRIVDEYIDTINEVSGEREAYIYRQGMLNCVDILKCLGVLA